MLPHESVVKRNAVNCLLRNDILQDQVFVVNRYRLEKIIQKLWLFLSSAIQKQFLNKLGVSSQSGVQWEDPFGPVVCSQ